MSTKAMILSVIVMMRRSMFERTRTLPFTYSRQLRSLTDYIISRNPTLRLTVAGLELAVLNGGVDLECLHEAQAKAGHTAMYFLGDQKHGSSMPLADFLLELGENCHRYGKTQLKERSKQMLLELSDVLADILQCEMQSDVKFAAACPVSMSGLQHGIKFGRTGKKLRRMATTLKMNATVAAATSRSVPDAAALVGSLRMIEKAKVGEASVASQLVRFCLARTPRRC
jgi:hypothetical protein